MHKSPFPPSVLRVTFANRGIYASEGTLPDFDKRLRHYARQLRRRKQNEKYRKLHGVY